MELHNSTDLEKNQDKIKSILKSQTLLKQQTFKNRCVKMYWGQIPLLSDVINLGFSGYAITEDFSSAEKPDLSSGNGTQIVIGHKSVIIWSASSQEELVEKIKQTFNAMEWNS